MGRPRLKRYTQHREVGLTASLSLAYLGICLFFFVQKPGQYSYLRAIQRLVRVPRSQVIIF
jgi:hypothetical protein